MAWQNEILAPTISRPRGLAEPPPAPWIVPARDDGDRADGAALAALAGTRFSSRFWSWAGLSGRRYVFSVYSPAACPAFCDALLLVALRDDTGRLSALAARDTGIFPEPVVARAERDFRAFGASLELHLHLLPQSPAERAATIADLSIAPG